MSDSVDRRQLSRRYDDVFAALADHLDKRRKLAIVKAPPGSGKTYLLLRAAAHAFKKGWRVAIATPTNAQSDDICRRFARDYPSVRTFRFAAQHMAQVDLGKTIRWARSPVDLPHDQCVVVGTTAKWGLVKLDDSFDFLFVDEAWQLDWAEFMLCGQVSSRFVLIGDPGQIPPVVSIDVQRWETSPRAPHLPAPDIILADKGLKPLLLELPACRRLPADAVDLVRPFYDFSFEAWAKPGERQIKLGAARGRENIDRALETLDLRSVAAVTLPTPGEGPPFELDEEIARLAAHVAARLIERRATAIDPDNGATGKLRPEDIGLAATHRVMNTAMAQALPSELRGRVHVDTPERWQGLERPVMIVIHPLSGVVRPSSFDLETGRLCVMASRHRCALIIVSRDHLQDTLEAHIPYAEQAVGRPDVTGRGHAQHLEFWRRIGTAGGVFQA